MAWDSELRGHFVRGKDRDSGIVGCNNVFELAGMGIALQGLVLGALYLDS